MAAKAVSLLAMLMGLMCTEHVLCQNLLVPYSVIESRVGNSVTLSCQNGGGFGQSDAVFFRNGVERESDPCLLDAVLEEDGSTLGFTLTPSCEGHYMCGVLDGKLVLSGPRSVFAYPQLDQGVDTGTLMVDAVEGESVQLPCNIERSALDQFEALWFRVIDDNSGLALVMKGSINPDYSLTLNNLEIGESGTYRCTVMASSSFLNDDSPLSASGRSIELTVRNRHIPIFFLSELSYSVDGGGNMLFSISARGTQSLLFQWFLEDEMVEDDVTNTITASLGSEVIVTSKLVLEVLPLSPSTLQVLASNMDPFTRETYIINRSALLIPSNPPPVTAVTEPPSSGNSDAEPEGCSLQEKALIGFFPAAIVLIAGLTVVLLLLLIFRKHIPFTVRMTSSESCNNSAPLIALSPRHTGTTVQDLPPPIVTVPDPAALYRAPSTPTVPKYSNPIANMLVRVAYLIQDQEGSNQDLNVMRAIGHILDEVLYRDDISEEAFVYMKELEREVDRYKFKIQTRRMYRRNLSRSSTAAITPGSVLSPGFPRNPPMLTSKSSIEEVHEPPKVGSPQSAVHQPEDMPDGLQDEDSDSDSEESNRIKISTDIVEKLSQLLSRIRQEKTRESN